MKTAAKRTLADMRRELWEECERLADETFRAYTRDIHTRLYLACKRSADGVIRELVVATEDADGRELVTADPIRRDRTRDQLAGWFRDQLSREPIWIYADG